MLALHRFVVIGIELLARGLDRLQALPLERLEQPAVDNLDAFDVFLIGTLDLERALEVVHDRKQALDHVRGGVLQEV